MNLFDLMALIILDGIQSSYILPLTHTTHTHSTVPKFSNHDTRQASPRFQQYPCVIKFFTQHALQSCATRRRHALDMTLVNNNHALQPMTPPNVILQPISFHTALTKPTYFVPPSHIKSHFRKARTGQSSTNKGTIGKHIFRSTANNEARTQPLSCRSSTPVSRR